MIKIITDSTSDIDVTYAKELNIDIVPLKVIIDGKEYKDRVDLQPDQFYSLLEKSEVLPTTSQPSPQEFLNYYEEAKEKGANVYAEASPHHFTLTEEAVLKYGTLARMNPPLRTEEDRQRIIKGLQEGTIEIIATDHAPHSKEEKDKPLDQAPSGITGIETSLALGVTELVEKGYLSMMQLLEKMTINPAKLYNMEQGRLQEGKPADVVLFDPEEEWEVKEYKSKATNSPFTGWKLKGKVKYTICDGKIIEL